MFFFKNVKVYIRLKTLDFLTSFMMLVLLFFQGSPVNSVGTITLSGSVNEAIGLYGSPNYSLTVAPGQIGASIIEEVDLPSDPARSFVGSVNFGNLSHGDGSNTTAKFGLRARGDTACHISSSVSSFSANNIRFDQTTISFLSDMDMIKLGTSPVISGSSGNASLHSYDSFWSTGTNTLSTMNGGIVSSVNSLKQKICSFSDAPSATGNLTSYDNYVESQVTFTLPTGFRWSATPGMALGSFSIIMEFEIYTGA